jgi:hypothetical protein
MNSPATHALSINPANGETISSLPWATTAEVDIAISLADTAFASGVRLPLPSVPMRCVPLAEHCANVLKKWRSVLPVKWASR